MVDHSNFISIFCEADIATLIYIFPVYGMQIYVRTIRDVHILKFMLTSIGLICFFSVDIANCIRYELHLVEGDKKSCRQIAVQSWRWHVYYCIFHLILSTIGIFAFTSVCLRVSAFWSERSCVGRSIPKSARELCKTNFKGLLKLQFGTADRGSWRKDLDLDLDLLFLRRLCF